ncbi:acid phosphatase [Novosphingobium sp.]|jgi:hypothetical protein|uniref:acid phosphatase n=1 Tax=Novosphingobium sp. TaxID=1874826 RepID=UPI002FDFE667
MRSISANWLVMTAACLLGGAVPAPEGYLKLDQRPDLTKILPEPPAPGSAQADADARIFRESCSLKGSPRWELATRDVSGTAFEQFACALGVRLQEGEAPAITHLLTRAGEDRSVVSDAKQHFHTVRPWVRNDLPICEPRSAHLAGNGDHPSGHTAYGQHVAMILAAITPDRATQLLARGREYGDSRWICGSHSHSAVEAGRLAGASIFAAEMNSPEFRADLDAARAEMAALREKSRSEPTGCAG